MPSWLLKAAAQRLVGALPGRHHWNELFQRHVTHSLDLSEGDFEAKVRDCRRVLEARDRFGRPDGAFTAFELGTGWYPFLAVGLFLCGAERVWTWDRAPLLRPWRVRLVFERFAAAADDGRLERLLPGVRSDRIGRLREALDTPGAGLMALLHPLEVRARVGDARRTGLRDASVDLFTSVVVLEYIERDVLAGILGELRRLAADGAVMHHVIDLTDQYAAFDGRLSPFHFLRFSDRTWRLLNNPLIPLSRLRVTDYRQLLAEAGFRIVDEELVRARDDALERVPLAPRFRGYPREDLFVRRATLVAVAA